MNPVEVKKGIYSVGAVDWNIRDFHGYSTYKGTSYNAFLALDEKITLFDTVKKPFGDTLLKNISKIVDPARINYLVVNHAELDHSGFLPEIVERVRPEKILCSPACRTALLDHFHREDWPFQEVKTGQNISLGQKTVDFIETKMLHWPDSMFSYLREDRVLISSDAFGQHWATSERFDDEVDNCELMRHAAKYYANILLPYSTLVQKLLKEMKGMGNPIDMIAPDHGIIWRGNPGKIIGAYDFWSRQESLQKAVIVYDTMWESTEKMAFSICEGLEAEGMSVKLMSLKENHRSEIVADIIDAAAIILGSSTLNNGMLPPMADMISYLKGLKPKGKMGAAFGSYGWSGEATGEIAEALQKMQIELIAPPLKTRYIPNEDMLKSCVELGRKIAAAIREKSDCA